MGQCSIGKEKKKKIRNIIPRSAGARNKEPLLFKEVRMCLREKLGVQLSVNSMGAGSQEWQVQSRAAKSHLPLSFKLSKTWDSNSATQGDYILPPCVVVAALD